jgi:hypothetical protein
VKFGAPHAPTARISIIVDGTSPVLMAARAAQPATSSIAIVALEVNDIMHLTTFTFAIAMQNSPDFIHLEDRENHRLCLLACCGVATVKRSGPRKSE